MTYPILPEADLLIHCGDATFIGDHIQVIEFNNWLGEIKHKFKHGILFVPGNHDIGFMRNQLLYREILSNAVTLIDESITIEGKLFYGTPWSPTFGKWAFMLNEEKLYLVYENIPHNVDVLISHAPPYGILDKNKQGVSCGSKSLLEAIKIKKPKNVLFGHIHEGYGNEVYKGIKIYNVSSVNEKYKQINLPILIDI